MTREHRGTGYKDKITKRAIDGLRAKAQEAARTIFLRDTDLTGFGAVSTKAGACRYFVEYRLGGRGTNQRRVTLGKHGVLTPEKARAKAKEELGKASNGVDVALLRKDRREKLTGASLKDAVERFLEVHAKQTRYWHEKRQRLLGADLKTLHGKPVTAISAAQLENELDKVKSRNASAHRLIFADLRPFFKWAKKRYGLAVNPMADADAPAPAKKRERVLEEHEIKAFWQAAGESVWPFASIYKLALLTGARREEVAAMRWAELDLNAGVWTLPAQEDFTFQRKRRDGTEFFEGRTKNTRAHRVPLPSMALALLDRDEILKIKAELGYPSGSDLVFSITGGTPPSGFSKQKRALDLRMAKLLGGKFKPWRIHDLRRTCATGMEGLGIDTRVVETALNHVSGTKAGIVGIYQRASHRDAVKTAFKAWAAQIAHLTGDDPGPSNVIPLKRPATQE